ncbi:MAG: M23 family metallopeptidase [Candidatus Peregrinibacteria bacterium]
MAVSETTLQVNRLARSNRHMKIFSKWNLVKIHAKGLGGYLSIPLIKLGRTPYFEKVGRFLNVVKRGISEILPASPQKKLYFQAVIISVSALVMSSLSPGGVFTHVSWSYSPDYISAYSLPGDVLVADEDGYLIKINPQTGDSNRVGMTDYAVHTIEDGETLSIIAERYGVSTATIMWENGLSNANTIRIGQKLLVPPVDGISYKVEGGDSLEKIADKYKVSVEAIIAQNSLESETIHKGQQIFLPGAEPIVPPSQIAGNYRTTGASRSVNYASSSSTPAVGRIFIFPTSGKITQGYRAGHYAIDIADTSMPPVWSAGGGTVTKVSTGTWGGGYGNHVIIDHGGGLQTLYAHLDSVNVYEGQFVSQGDVLGVMGNTGRVYGVTGIHLHWEVIQDGVKQYPGNYY